MNVNITTLVDNSVGTGSSRELIAEHGLAFLIEIGKQRILFDTGQFLALQNNARVLGKDLASVDTVVLSHGHYDHTGGLRHLLELNGAFSLYAHPDVFTRKMIKRNGQYRQAGIPVSKDELVKKGVTLNLNTAASEVCPGIMTTGEIPLESAFEKVAEGFFVENNGRMVPDALADDQALVVKSARGLVVVLGCSHRGIINTLCHVRKIAGDNRIYAALGGLHLVKTSGQKLETILHFLEQFQLEKLVVGHCTGSHAAQALSARFKDKVVLNTVGHTFSV